jgi:nucleoside-diphosphate-sugar epimerase
MSSFPLLIVGGTGLVASAVIREFQKNSQIPNYHNHHILALSRSASKQSVEGVTFVQGNALDPQSLKGPLESNPNVVHTVGTLLDQSKKYGADGSYDRLNRDAAISVADAMAEKYDGIHRRCMVYFSASKAPPSFMLNERYLQAKREAEQALLGQKYKDKLRVVVLRPGRN